MGASIKDVARRAGVSVTSVSRVLNGERYISEELLARVNQAIADLNYSPSHIARSLKKQKTSMIGIIVPDITNHFFSSILSSIENTASEYGYNLIICNIAEDLDKEFKYLQSFQAMRVDGIMIMHQKTDERILAFIENTTTPVLFSCVKSPLPSKPSVLIDDYRAAYDATSYLIASGHTDIAIIGGDLRDESSGAGRLNGYLDALKAHNLSVTSEYIKFGDYKLESGRTMMRELLELKELPSVVFAVSDDMAVGALNAALDYGLKVPQDISIIGFDGSRIAEAVRPTLTTMQQPMEKIGKASLECLHAMIEKEASAGEQDVILPHTLVERESCRRLAP
ncbi:LacI family DNA-binding transcriptional regulator [Paenibacillus sp. 1P07SE]|uniref:LacI family DNA-binding transcriptional regulator n=1 Tax=Paenibacillus sp. 1P07SE TaxID=3132209 RepID=UPI0039A767AD